MQSGEALKRGIQRLKNDGVPSPRMNAELLLMFVLGRDRAYLYGHPEVELSREEQARYEDALAQRATGMPVQYITGHQEFWGIDLIVSPAVLIPRPETEHVVEAALDRVGRRLLSARSHANRMLVSDQAHAGEDARASKTQTGATGGSGVNEMKIVDVGTGSGCIALALAKELPNAEIHATDISAEAIEIARANATRHQLSDRIHFHETDLLQGLERGAFDFVISNPPYVGDSEEDQVQLEVRKFEPRQAVFAGPTGMEAIDRLIRQAQEVLRPGGWLIFEISGTIAEPVRESLASWKDVQVKNDLQGIPRVASAQKII